MKRRLMAVLMACVMTLSLLPISALAAENSGMEFYKDARDNRDGTYTISMEAWATGKTTTQVKPQPLDIALVLDVSGSMADPFTKDSTTYTEVYAPALNKDNIYYVYTNYYGGYYYKVSWCSTCNAWTDGCRDGLFGHYAGTHYTPKQNAGDTSGTQFYVKQETAGQSKLDALKIAVNGFIDGVAKNSPKSNISIVKFAGEMTDKVGNDTYRESGYRYNYTQIVRNLTPVETGKDALKAAVSSLQAAGATSADYGMELARGELASPTLKNPKVVVMFTDGEPNHYSGFDYNVAAQVVNTAKSMKDGGTTIYTVGVFTDLSEDLRENVNNYMNATSSNYPQATATDDFDVTWGEGSDKGYYKTASNAAELNNIFTTISQDISSAANAALNASTTVVDTLSEYFTFANTPGGDVKVYTADWNGNSWNEKVEAPANVTPSVDGKTVRVTGYNYAEHYVHGTEGQKLIIEITVVADPTATWGPTNEYPTNQGNAAVMLGEQVIEEQTSPAVRVATYQVRYQVNGDAPDNTTYDDPKYYISGQQATVLQKPSNCEKDGYSYTFDGWRLGEDEAPAVLTMTDDVTLTGTWTKAPILYNITYDLDSGALAEGEENPATYTVETETFTLHNPTRENYTFTGWTGTDLSEKTEQVTVAKGSTGDREYKANWELTTFADKIIVTIKGNTGSEKYNGSEQSVTGYTMEITQDNAEHPYSLDYVECPAQTGAIAKGTDVGKHSMGLKAGDFKNSNPQYPNVTFIVEDGYLEITPKPATITVDPAKKFFGEKDPEFTGKVEGLIGKNDLGKISYSRTNKDEAVGTYKEVLDATYTANSNYTVKVVKGNFTIKTAASDAVLSAEGGEWEYDGTAHAASATVSDETFTIYYKAGDGEWTATAPSVTNVSDGLVTVSVKATKDGYNDLTCDNVTLKITPRPATITVDPAEKSFGEKDPEFTGKVEGLIGKNDLGKISYSRTNKDEAVGTYEGVLDATYTENKNYTVKVVKGNFTIKTAASDAALSAAGGEWEYDGKAHAASATVSDPSFTIYYKAGDGEWTATAPSVTNVSDGLVTVSVKATKDGYNDLTCDNVTLKITPKPVTVTANDMYVFSGSPVPTYSAQVEGTINDDKITYTISCDYTEAAGAGEFFDIIPSGEAEQGNYVVTYVNGTLEVRQLPNLAFNLGQYIQKDLRIIGSRAFTGATYSATMTPVVNNELGKAMTITVSYSSGESGLKPFVGELGFTERGSYRYEVKEIIPSGATGYDTSVYYLTVDVGLNDDELVVDKVTKTLAGGSEDPSEGAIVFCNTYNTGTIYVPVVKPALNRDDHYAYVVGYPDGMVRPSGNITRAEAATIFFRLLTDDSRNQFWMTTNTYSDVNRGDWFNNAVSTLSNAGIISGYPDGTFRPNAPITRAEMSKIIALFAKLNKSEDRFNDIAGHWAEAYIKLAAGNGWIAGYPDGSFKPQQNITRAETMTMINRVLERVPSVESHLLPYNAMLTFPDCQSGQWFYIAVQEATNSHTYERAASEKNGDEQWIALRANRDWTQFQN